VILALVTDQADRATAALDSSLQFSVVLLGSYAAGPGAAPARPGGVAGRLGPRPPPPARGAARGPGTADQ